MNLFIQTFNNLIYLCIWDFGSFGRPYTVYQVAGRWSAGLRTKLFPPTPTFKINNIYMQKKFHMAPAKTQTHKHTHTFLLFSSVTQTTTELLQ